MNWPTKNNPMDVCMQTVVCSCGETAQLTKNRANDPLVACLLAGSFALIRQLERSVGTVARKIIIKPTLGKFAELHKD